MWNVCRYFDDYYECIISTHKTLKEAKEAKYKLKTGVYVSYHVQKAVKPVTKEEK